MFNLHFSIENPFNISVNQKEIFEFHHKVTKNKNIESQITFFGLSKLFSMGFDTSWSGYDHAGPSVYIEFFGLYFRLAFFDTRHWNYKTNNWEVYPGESDEKNESRINI